MKTRVKVEAQVETFVKSLAPEPRRKLTLAIKALSEDQGDLKRLEGKLDGYVRLRVSGYRVIFKERFEKGERIIDCIYAENRSVVYELFLRLLSEGLHGLSEIT
jgi:mRNA-degrading endonuclease RelE of RelBE toxin-antitoxin system